MLGRTMSGMTDPHDVPEPPSGITEARAVLPGSERTPLPGAAAAAAAATDEPITVTVVLRRKQALPESPAAPLDRAELAERYGAAAADVDTVRSVVEASGAQVTEVDPGSRRLRVSGAAGTLEQLFGTSLTTVTAPNPVTGGSGEFRARVGELSVPAQLSGIVTAVLGLDNRPQARARVAVAHANVVSMSYTPVELGKIYRFPAGTDGSGQTVAIIELGGGFKHADLTAYFKKLGLPTPKVTAVGVDHAENAPDGNPDGADGEVLLDVEVIGALAPETHVLVYFAPNTDAGFVDAIAQAAHATPTPAVISISWGQSEDDWTPQARGAMDDACADAVALGVTVTAAAGDDGSPDRSTDSRDHCDFPASSPHVLACGGTALIADPDTGAVSSERVWNNGVGHGATGGGVSDAFPVPSWQSTVGVPPSTGGQVGRGVPDVSAVADPRTGYKIRVDGEDMVIGGTSAVAPLWAALTARLVQALGRPLGLLQPALYAAATPGHSPAGFRDITEGTNGAYSAGPGWDPCTGLGVPDGEALLASLRGGAAVGS